MLIYLKLKLLCLIYSITELEAFHDKNNDKSATRFCMNVTKKLIVWLFFRGILTRIFGIERNIDKVVNLFHESEDIFG